MSQNLPFDAVIFDLDGVITQTALVHSVAWKEMFDNYLKSRETRYSEPFREFTHENDYLKFVDGKPRYEGVKSFLESRNIVLPFGNPNDSEEMETCCGIGNMKNLYFNRILDRDGVKVYQSTVDLIYKLKELGVAVGVASSSKNCESVLQSANLLHLIETRVDGVVSAELGLKGKPEADIFTTAADNLKVDYHRTIVVEDAISGVQAAKKGNFGLVLGLAREDNHLELKANGADIVIEDIEEIDIEDLVFWFENGLKEDGWSLTYHDYNPANERSREALLSVSNGYFGTRGAMEEMDINSINYPGTYMAGVFNRLISSVSGRNIDNEDFVNVINWLPISFKINDGDWFDVNTTTILNLERKLDFKTGQLFKVMLVEDNQGRQTQIYTRRFASMSNPHIASIHYCLQAVNYSGTLTYRSKLIGSHINDGVERYSQLNQKHLEPVFESATDNRQCLIVKTTESNRYISASAQLKLMLNGEFLDIPFQHEISDGEVKSVISTSVEPGTYLGLIKTVWLENSASNDFSKDKIFGDYEEELAKTVEAWEKIWQKIDVIIEGDRLSQKLIRLHLYHLISGTSENNIQIDFGIPARSLTGEAYRGHIFWDELYILPFYFIHYPEIAKSVLMYRYRRLDAARAYAKEFGYEGAMFPWQSGSDGREETQKFHFNPLSGHWGDDHSSLQRHVSLAIAYNIIQYFKFTEDEVFMTDYGIEMLIEIGKFWASKCDYDPVSGKYSIDKVMGPDEFHEAYPNQNDGGLKNNAYTNLMTVWMFDEIQSIFNKLNYSKIEPVIRKTEFNKNHFEFWNKISKNLKLDISHDGIIAQYEGYFDLKELDWDYYHKKYGNVHRMDRVLKAENLSPDEFKVAKQADTLMTFYNLDDQKVTSILESLGYNLPQDYIKRNLEYYLKRTSHGSTLSRVVHSYLANQLQQYDLSWSMYHEALNSDFNDIQGGTTAEGIHTGVMAGTVWIIVSTFAGIKFDRWLSINPYLPMHWNKIEFGLDYKGIHYDFKFSKTNFVVLASKNVEIEFKNKLYTILANQSYSFNLLD